MLIDNSVLVFDDYNERCFKAKRICNFYNDGLIKISSNTHIVAPFNFKTITNGILDIGTNCRIMAGARIYSNRLIKIGDYTCIAENVHIRSFSGHLINGKSDSEEIVIGKACWIGSDVTILPGVHIGNGSIVGACSVVTKDIPPNSLAVGNPAKVIKTNVVWGNNNYSLIYGND